MDREGYQEIRFIINYGEGGQSNDVRTQEVFQIEERGEKKKGGRLHTTKKERFDHATRNQKKNFT